MRAAVLHAPGDLRIEEVPFPAAGPGEALVLVAAAGICGSDIGRVMQTGTYRFQTIPGHEFAGTVAAVGPEVTSVALGDRVAVAPLLPCGRCEACARNQYSLCEDYDFLASRRDGGVAQYLAALARNLVRVPEGMSLEAAAMIEPAAIVLHGLHKVSLALVDAVLVAGCGALGLFALQFAKLSGAMPLIAADVDPDKLALSRRVGADTCINPTETDAPAAIHGATGGRGAALALEAAGSDAARDLAILSTARQGRVVLYGTVHGDVRVSKAAFDRLVRHEIEFIGSWNCYSVPFPGTEWFDGVTLLAEGRLLAEPLVTRRLSLDEAPGTFCRLGSRSFGPYGKILFRPNC